MKVRIRFSKTGIMKYIGHLDVMHFFQQLLRRSGVPIAYSGGMSPHQIMSFALPLGIGLESLGEYLDIELTAAMSSQEAIERMNGQTVEGIEILSFRALPEKAQNAMASVAAADYFIDLAKTGLFSGEEELSEKLTAFLQRPTLPVIKKTKKNEQEIDLRPLIYEGQVKDGGLFFRLSCGSVDNIKPALVMDAFFRENGLTDAPDLSVTRYDLYTGGESGYLSLDAVGTDIP
ncbi:MAG: TIGR03936 family radical SAM-associated protein [Lachnospiraceae bacterium]|nr:TIGR03936 family radical SAM-associated protein [Lachnospiraceae bacterium]